MTTLRCGVTECAHNKSDCCCHNEITVGGSNASTSEDTKCKNFSENTGAMTNDVRDANPDLFVNCSAGECMHNKGQRCNAGAVYINSDSTASSQEGTECVTFEAR